MVEAGSLTLRGDVQQSNILSAFTRLKNSLSSISKNAKGTRADFVRMGQAAVGLGKAVGRIGLLAAGLLALAKSAPAVAPAMAMINVEFNRLKRILGEQLQPLFEAFARTFTKFVNFVQAHPNLSKAFVIGAGVIAGVLGLAKGISILTKAYTFLKAAVILLKPRLAILFAGLLGPILLVAAALTAVLLIFKNIKDIKAGGATIKRLATDKEFRGRAGRSLKSLGGGPGFDVSDVTEGAKLLLSPLAELFGANPYTPEGWRKYGSFQATQGGVNFILNEQDRKQQLMANQDTSWG